MPRGPRLDAPGVLHHVMVRGVEQREIFPHDDDRADLVGRLARLLPDTHTTCVAWCLLPNQLHLALRSGPNGLAHVMRRLLTGYAGAFNRRHSRAGYLFQNRYQSTACEELYLPALVRHVHVNPLRAGLVPDAAALSDFGWCGHGALMGRAHHEWQATAEVLGRFGATLEEARRAYEDFVVRGFDNDRESRRTETAERVAAGMIAASAPPGAGTGGAWGSAEFVAGLRAQTRRVIDRVPADCRVVVENLCRALGLSPQALASGRRTRPLSNGRAVVAYVARTRYRISGVELAEALGMSPPAVTQAERRGALLLKRRVDLRSGLQEFLH